MKLLLCSDVSLSFHQSYFSQCFNIIIVQLMNVLSTVLFVCFLFLYYDYMFETTQIARPPSYSPLRGERNGHLRGCDVSQEQGRHV